MWRTPGGDRFGDRVFMLADPAADPRGADQQHLGAAAKRRRQAGRIVEIGGAHPGAARRQIGQARRRPGGQDQLVRRHAVQQALRGGPSEGARGAGYDDHSASPANVAFNDNGCYLLCNDKPEE